MKGEMTISALAMTSKIAYHVDVKKSLYICVGCMEVSMNEAVDATAPVCVCGSDIILLMGNNIELLVACFEWSHTVLLFIEDQ